MKSRTYIALLTLAVCTLAGAYSCWATVTAVTPIFGQLIAVTYPPPFKVVNEETKGPYYLQESVKEGETVNDWSEMITLTGRQGAASAPQASAMAFVLDILKGFQSACPSTFAVLQLGQRKIDGREGFAAIGSCGSVSSASRETAHSETALILGIKGSADIYTLQWAQRGPPSDRPLALSADPWMDRFKQLDPIHVCEHGPNEIQVCGARK